MLIEHGHPDALSYPLCRIWEEAQLVVERQNQALKTTAVLNYQAVSSAIGAAFGNKKSANAFNKLLKEMGE